MWDFVVNLLFQILEGIQSFCGDWGLAIIILVVIIRLLLTPLTVKSLKSTAQMQVLQPKLLALQERFEDDPQRLQEEMMKFYNENKFNPLGGCLPIFLQMPIFFALFSVLRDRLPEGASFFGIIPNLASSVSQMLSQGFVAALPYIISLVAFGLLTMIPSLISSRDQTGPQASQMRMMAVVMGCMMLFVGWGIPAGVLVYYNTSALWQFASQLIITKRVTDKARAEQEAKFANAPVEVEVVRREHKKRPHKKH